MTRVTATPPLWASRSLKGMTCPRHAGADDPRGVARGGAWRTRSSATSPSWAMVFAPGAEQGSEAALGCQPASKFMWRSKTKVCRLLQNGRWLEH